jgi:hypothetical protein
MNKQYLLLALIISISSSLWAQTNESLNTDRPDQSEGVYTLPKGQFQAENGLVFGKEEITDNLMFRYGLITNTEVRLEANFDLKTPDFSSTVFSVKQRLWQSERYLPCVSLIGYGQYSKAEATPYSFDACLAFESVLTNNLSLAYSLSSVQQFEAYNFTTELNYTPTAKFWGFVEYYATYQPHCAPLHNIDVGIAYFLKPNLQLDLSGGRTLFQPEANYFIGIGAGYLFK